MDDGDDPPTWWVCWHAHVYRHDRVPSDSGECPRTIYISSRNDWVTCGTGIHPMTPEELAAYLLGGVDAIRALYPDRVPDLPYWHK